MLAIRKSGRDWHHVTVTTTVLLVLVSLLYYCGTCESSKLAFPSRLLFLLLSGVVQLLYQSHCEYGVGSVVSPYNVLLTRCAH